MIAQERFQSIITLVAARQKLSVHELQSTLGVSPATLRRDLAELESLGKVVRVRGAVVHPAYFRGEPSFAQKRRTAAAVKRAIAQIAAELVPPDATVWIDAGTTALELGARLLARRDLTIVTHSIPLAARAVENEDGARVLLVGGEVRAISGAAVGALALEWTRHLRADWCFLGASGLHSSEGASTTEVGEAALKTAILKRCQRKVLLCDSTKWETPATIRFAAWSNFDFWVSGGELSAEARAVAENLGPQLLWAET